MTTISDLFICFKFSLIYHLFQQFIKVFIIFNCFLQLCHSYNDPIKEFSKHEIVLPKVLPPFNQTISASQKLYENQLKIVINAFNNTFLLNLWKNSELIPKNYFERHQQNGSDIKSLPHLENVEHCHYRGTVDNNIENTWSAISTCHQLISGLFSDGHDIYHIHPQENSSSVIVVRDQDYISSFKCGFLNDTKSRESLIRRFRRSISITDPYESNSDTRYVELVIVNDYDVYTQNKRNKATVFDRSKRIANIVNALYNQLNIFVVLVGVVIWTEANQITLSTDGDQTLTNFLHYRRERLIREHPNDNAQLITGSSFDGGVVGKALKGSICTFEYSGGVNTDHSQITSLVATTVAHELGHNFGMEHDSDKCRCPNDKCIMAPSSSSISPKHWSSCSLEYLEHSFKQGMDHCLHNKPRDLFGPVCGNGFLEEGEECDCGLKSTCDNKCCNATTCKLMPGAQCAVGSCCDKTKCKIVDKSQDMVCRPAKSNCDLTEFCDGISEFCPEDLKVQDGTECIEGFAYCFAGKCDTRESQCKLLWGKTGEVSDYKCYQQNIKGNANGNCGYFKQNQTYISCKAQDVICGRLHCFHQSEQLKYGTESAAILARSFIPNKGKVLACRSAMVDLGIDIIDPGLVPNGAKCGSNSMCINQKCVSVKDFLQKNACADNCHKNGLCDNKGVCHCYPGFAPPNCSHTITSKYLLTIAMYILFFVILPLTVIAVLLIYKYNDTIKNWWFIKARKSAIKSRAKQVTHRKHTRPPINFNTESLEISSPISLEMGTKNSNNLSDIRSNSNNSDITSPLTNTEKASTTPLRPIRTAPPPPISNHSSISRTSSMRSSNRSSSGIQYNRPSQPPPPRPPRPHNSTQDNNLSNIHPLNVPEFKADKPLPSLPKPNISVKYTSNTPKQTSVANLAKKFEKLNN
ncbi:zinc metalloproteinase-disintegrin-like EoMP06 [Oppia nitens]|uniref:zinc metalloproteinase-disintegrin-like EoMP06 n=1 Tax=Oppia nitens TaxID=1686743 RepID=UPI0023DC31AE|nr:zinc metalloproteinase-disintegrin-like EoMP06 [Oppia nitens]